MEKKKSVGVMVLGIYTLVISLLGFAEILLTPVYYNPPLLLSQHYIRQIPGFIFFTLLLIGGLGVLNFRKWSRILVIILWILWLIKALHNLYGLMIGTIGIDPRLTDLTLLIVLPIMIPILPIVFLTRLKIKEQFR